VRLRIRLKTLRAHSTPGTVTGEANMAGQQQANGSGFDAAGHQRGWEGFTVFMKWGVISVVVLLLLMALFLL
jgi:hypothetical protein